MTFAARAINQTSREATGAGLIVVVEMVGHCGEIGPGDRRGAPPVEVTVDEA